MGLPVEKVGTTYRGSSRVIDPEHARAYAAATSDPNPAYERDACAPPLFAVVPAWDAINRAIADVVPPDALSRLVHSEQDVHFRAPLVPGGELTSTATAHSIRVSRTGTRYTVRVESLDGQRRHPVVEQFVTVFVRGMRDGSDAGPAPPDHAFPNGARARAIGVWHVHVDADQAARYAAASGDRNPIHLDDAFARAAGLPGTIVHGLCTMAMAGGVVVRSVAGNDPARVRRLAARFSNPVFPGTELAVAVFDAGGGPGRRAFAFEAHTDGRRVLADGRVEVVAA